MNDVAHILYDIGRQNSQRYGHGIYHPLQLDVPQFEEFPGMESEIKECQKQHLRVGSNSINVSLTAQRSTRLSDSSDHQ